MCTFFRTPHYFLGPQDISISKYFSDEPEGFYLKEWTYSELANMLKNFNYSLCYGYWSRKGKRFRVPISYFKVIEKVLMLFQNPYKRLFASRFVGNIDMVAIK